MVIYVSLSVHYTSPLEIGMLHFSEVGMPCTNTLYELHFWLSFVIWKAHTIWSWYLTVIIKLFYSSLSMMWCDGRVIALALEGRGFRPRRRLNFPNLSFFPNPYPVSYNEPDESISRRWGVIIRKSR